METSISKPTINETFLWCFARYFDVEVHEMSNIFCINYLSIFRGTIRI